MRMLTRQIISTFHGIRDVSYCTTLIIGSGVYSGERKPTEQAARVSAILRYRAARSGQDDNRLAWLMTFARTPAEQKRDEIAKHQLDPLAGHWGGLS